jgi:hypothetical protein
LQPPARFHVGSAERWSNDAAVVRADPTQRVQVGKQTIWIDARHEPILGFLATLSVGRRLSQASHARTGPTIGARNGI